MKVNFYNLLLIINLKSLFTVYFQFIFLGNAYLRAAEKFKEAIKLAEHVPSAVGSYFSWLYDQNRFLYIVTANMYKAINL